AFPSDEVGPLDSWAFARLAASCFSDVAMWGRLSFPAYGGLSRVWRAEGPETLSFWLVTDVCGVELG
ncbi:MAG TPA: hypothetical protein VHZ55_31835, partial [Bryobacteraceae bacterium]|nr:hypothetical protein [Bryobacteraceae bacterium]